MSNVETLPSGNNKRKSSLDVTHNMTGSTDTQSTAVRSSVHRTQHLSHSADNRAPSAPIARPKHSLIDPDPILLPPSPTTTTRTLHARRPARSRQNTVTRSPTTDHHTPSTVDSSSSDASTSDDDTLHLVQQRQKRHMSISSGNAPKHDVDNDVDLMSRSPTVISLLNTAPHTAHNAAHNTRPATERLPPRRIAAPSQPPYSSDGTRHRPLPSHSMSVDGAPLQYNNTDHRASPHSDELELQFEMDLKSDNEGSSSPNPARYVPSSRAVQSNTYI